METYKDIKSSKKYLMCFSNDLVINFAPSNHRIYIGDEKFYIPAYYYCVEYNQ